MAVDAHPLSLFSGICTRASSRTLYSYIGETTSDEEEEEVIYQFTFHQSRPSTGLRVAHPSRAAVGYTLYLYNIYIYIYILFRREHLYIYTRVLHILLLYLCVRSHYIAPLRAIDSICPGALYTSRGEFWDRPAGIIIKLMMTERTSGVTYQSVLGHCSGSRLAVYSYYNILLLLLSWAHLYIFIHTRRI